MKTKHLIPKVAMYLIGAGLLFTLLGYALSGFSANRYFDYHQTHWYDVIHIKR